MIKIKIYLTEFHTVSLRLTYLLKMLNYKEWTHFKRKYNNKCISMSRKYQLNNYMFTRSTIINHSSSDTKYHLFTILTNVVNYYTVYLNCMTAAMTQGTWSYCTYCFLWRGAVAKCLSEVALDSLLPTTRRCTGSAGGGTRLWRSRTSCTQCGGNSPASPLPRWTPSNNPQSVAPVTEKTHSSVFPFKLLVNFFTLVSGKLS